MEDELILHYHDVVIRQSDLKTLEPGQWLNDTMLSFHMEFLERTFVPKEAKILFLRPGMVQLITFMEGDVTQLEGCLPPNMEQYEIIFMPINDGKPSVAYSGTHWALLVFVRCTKSFHYYDSLKFNNLQDAELSYKRIQPLLKLDQPAHLIPSSAPQQKNGFDCGVYVIAMIDYLLEHLLKSRGKLDIAYDKIMMLKFKQLSTPKQVRDNINGMIQRLQQRANKVSV